MYLVLQINLIGGYDADGKDHNKMLAESCRYAKREP